MTRAEDHSPTSPPPNSPHAYRVVGRDPVGDWFLLILSTAIITLSFLMSIKGDTQVCFPGTTSPLPETCNFRRWSGLDCPGCGMTRAFISIARGDFAKAWNYNPASPFFYLLVACQIPFRAVQLWRIRGGGPPIFVSGWGYTPAFMLMALLLGQWIVRVIAPFLSS